MTNLNATITPSSINVFFEGRMRTIPDDHMNFKKIEKLLKDINDLRDKADGGFSLLGKVFGSKEQRIERAITKLRILLDIPAYLTKLTEGLVRVTDKGVLFGDQPIHNVLAERIMDHLHRGLDVRPLAKFMNRVMANPKKDIAHELFEWMEEAKLPITSDGKMIAFKKVAGDYTSIHVGPGGTKVSNAIGQVVRMDRADVDEDRTRTCSTGLHFCGYTYLTSYGTGGENRVVVVEIDPENVCAIPTDYNAQKGRACEYKVIGEVNPDEAAEFFHGTPLITGGTVGNDAFVVPETTETHDVFEEEYDDDDDNYDWVRDEDEYDYRESHEYHPDEPDEIFEVEKLNPALANMDFTGIEERAVAHSFRSDDPGSEWYEEPPQIVKGGSLTGRFDLESHVKDNDTGPTDSQIEDWAIEAKIERDMEEASIARADRMERARQYDIETAAAVETHRQKQEKLWRKEIDDAQARLDGLRHDYTYNRRQNDDAVAKNDDAMHKLISDFEGLDEINKEFDARLKAAKLNK